MLQCKLGVSIAVTVSDGRVAPCLPGVELWVVPEGAAPEAKSILETKGWSVSRWAPELMKRDVHVLMSSGVDRFLVGVLLGNGIEVMPDVVGDASAALNEWFSADGSIPLSMRHHGLRGCRRERIRKRAGCRGRRR